MSSKYNKWVTSMGYVTCIPMKNPFFFASNISLLSPSTTKRNINCDKGHPYLRPLDVLKNPGGEPFIITTKFADSTHPIIQLTN